VAWCGDEATWEQILNLQLTIPADAPLTTPL
jgi:hypothetical protein